MAQLAREVFMRDVVAEHEIEVFVGADRVVRFNVDGVCVARAKAEGRAIIVIKDRYDKPVNIW